MPGAELRVLTWNLFHGRDGMPGLAATPGSTWRRRPAYDDTHVHLNRALTDQMAARIAAWEPDVCALQEVPTRDVRAIVRRTGMHAIWTTTGPLLGPTRLRDALAARNPDLWRTHEGNANVLLVGGRWRPVAGSGRSARLNPLGAIARAAIDLELEAGELLRYLPEPRRAVMTVVRGPGGEEVAVGCLHLHNARHAELIRRELAVARRAVEELAGDRPAVLAGDFNLEGPHPALAFLAQEGWQGVAADDGLAIDRIVHRDLEEVEAQRRLPAREREVLVTWAGIERRVRLSDHDPVVATLRVSAS